MIVNLYKLIEKKFKKNIEDETTLNLALDVLNQRENLAQENKKYKEVINKTLNLLGNYTHYSTPDEIQNSYNEYLANKAYDILKEVEHE